METIEYIEFIAAIILVSVVIGVSIVCFLVGIKTVLDWIFDGRHK